MIDKLEFLLALAREKHFGRAAEACGVTQPTLSAGVKQIEDSFGVLLVNRGSRFQGFTPEGERVLDWARRIVGDARAMREEVHSLKHGLTGRLRIAAIPTTLAMVERLTTPYRARHPNVQFTIYSRNSFEILDLLENLEVEAGITYVENEPLGRVNTVPLYRERYRLLTSAEAPLGNRDNAIGPVSHGTGALPNGDQPPSNVRPRTGVILPCRFLRSIIKPEIPHGDFTCLAHRRINRFGSAAARE